MTYKEYCQTVKYELYRSFKGDLNLFQKIRIRYFQPNTNCMLMARKMWYFYSRGGVMRLLSKFYYIKIQRRYSCIIFPTAIIGKGFYITHPTGIVIGNCKIGEDFVIYQNCTIGGKLPGDDSPQIGNNVHLATNSVLIGHIQIADDVYIGAASFVNKNVLESGYYGGNPLKKLK